MFVSYYSLGFVWKILKYICAFNFLSGVLSEILVNQIVKSLTDKLLYNICLYFCLKIEIEEGTFKKKIIHLGFRANLELEKPLESIFICSKLFNMLPSRFNADFAIFVLLLRIGKSFHFFSLSFRIEFEINCSVDFYLKIGIVFFHNNFRLWK